MLLQGGDKHLYDCNNSLIILAGGHPENTGFLKIIKGCVLLRMCLCPVVISGKILYGTKQPLVISFKHSFLLQLPLKIEKFEWIFGSICGKPV